jgi:hypothetical protein
MSWSVSATAVKSDVAAKAIESQFASYTPCPEPEESIKQAARDLIAQALAGNVPSREVSVSAWGSQTTSSGGKGAPDVVSNTLSITIS